MTSHRRWGLGIAALLTLGMVACSPEPRQSSHVNLPPPNGNAEYVVKFPDEKPGEVRGINIDLGPDTAMECRDLKPKFFFDQSKPTPEDEVQMRALGHCLSRPGMEKTQIMLVGRADAKGTDDYNKALGERRAKTVKDLLVKEGVPAERIGVTSAGEAGATGNTPTTSEGWDRRVDIQVSGTVHAP